jgi:hypothetical protein
MADFYVSGDEFWETQKILDEFERDTVTPVLGSPKVEAIPDVPDISAVPAPPLTPQEQVEALLHKAYNAKECYTCGHQTPYATKENIPMCVNCTLQHMVKQ